MFRSPLSLIITAVLVTACASVEPIAYTPDPSRVKDPQTEIAGLIQANTVEGCLTEPEFNGTVLNVKAACTNQGVGNTTIRFDRVKVIKLEKSGEWYRCTVEHEDGIDAWFWTSKSLRDMQELADAIAALAGAAGAPVEEAPGMKAQEI